MIKLVEGMFHANAVLLSGLALLAYNTDGGMLLAALLFSMVLLTEAGVILFKDEADPLASIERKVRKVQRKVAKIKAKKEKEKREQYLCSKCQQTTPVMS